MPWKVLLSRDFRCRKILYTHKIKKRPFVRNSVCSQFLEGLFAILAECSQFCLLSFNRNSKGNPSFCWLGGGGKGHKIVNKNFVNKRAFPKNSDCFCSIQSSRISWDWVLPGVSDGVSRTCDGVSEGVSGDHGGRVSVGPFGPRALFLRVSPECPKSVWDTLRILVRHSGARSPNCVLGTKFRL